MGENNLSQYPSFWFVHHFVKMKSVVLLLVALVAIASAASNFKADITVDLSKSRAPGNYWNQATCDSLYGKWYFRANTRAASRGLATEEAAGSDARYDEISGAAVGTAVFNSNCDITFSGFKQGYDEVEHEDIDEFVHHSTISFYEDYRFRYDGDYHLACVIVKNNVQFNCIGNSLPTDPDNGAYGEIVEYYFVRGNY